MKFNEIPIEGSYLIELEPNKDERGFFSRIFCSNEFSNMSLNSNWRQVNSAFNFKKGTLRGLHFQIGTDSEVKLVKCIKGSIWDVFVDLRTKSKTFKKWYGCNLDSDTRNMLYIPKGCAHGYITLEENSEIMYFVSSDYSKSSERSIIWNDTMININWPIKPNVISEKDMHASSFKDLDFNIFDKIY